jgi:acyl-CoA thioester hydrolase
MEEARVECFSSLGLEFADLVALGCDLPVAELQVRYHRALRMGMPAVVRVRLEPVRGVRLNFEYQIQSPDGQELYLTARVTLVPVDRHKNKIVRQLPPVLKAVLARL